MNVKNDDRAKLYDIILGLPDDSALINLISHLAQPELPLCAESEKSFHQVECLAV